MRIGIDARFYGTGNKGLGKYTQKLIENLEEIYLQIENKKNGHNNDQFFIFLRKDNFNEYHPKSKNFKKVLADYKWYSFSEQIKMPQLLNKYKLDLVHFPHFNVPFFYRKKFIVTIHDLILLHFPTIRGTTLNPILYWLKFLAYKIIINRAIKKSNKIITVSNFTKDDILANYLISSKKIIVTYEACDDDNSYSQKSVSEIDKYGIIKPYLLYVGNAYPHKNLERMAEAWQIFNTKQAKHLHLVLVGRKDYFYNQLQKTVKEKKIKNII
ncbi:MAG TPA: glycosyltransferase family 1 protein, partial [Candidatus Moranbacteria bacterium]|nr:glycosyltransferase family 1 protein [Candidatus Moranbacteria bacterium]